MPGNVQPYLQFKFFLPMLLSQALHYSMFLSLLGDESGPQTMENIGKSKHSVCVQPWMKWRSIDKLNMSRSVIWVRHRLAMERVAHNKESRIIRICPHPLSFPLPTLLTSPEQQGIQPCHVYLRSKRKHIELQCVIPSLKGTKCLLINNTWVVFFFLRRH